MKAQRTLLMGSRRCEDTPRLFLSYSSIRRRRCLHLRGRSAHATQSRPLDEPMKKRICSSAAEMGEPCAHLGLLGWWRRFHEHNDSVGRRSPAPLHTPGRTRTAA